MRTGEELRGSGPVSSAPGSSKPRSFLPSSGRASSSTRVIRSGSNNQNLALAMAYVPMQCLKNAYCLEEALRNGTLFPELDKPFTGVKGGCACGR